MRQVSAPYPNRRCAAATRAAKGIPARARACDRRHVGAPVGNGAEHEDARGDGRPESVPRPATDLVDRARARRPARAREPARVPARSAGAPRRGRAHRADRAVQPRRAAAVHGDVRRPRARDPRRAGGGVQEDRGAAVPRAGARRRAAVGGGRRPPPPPEAARACVRAAPDRGVRAGDGGGDARADRAVDAGPAGRPRTRDDGADARDRRPHAVRRRRAARRDHGGRGASISRCTP